MSTTRNAHKRDDRLEYGRSAAPCRLGGQPPHDTGLGSMGMNQCRPLTTNMFQERYPAIQIKKRINPSEEIRDQSGR